MKIIKGCKTCEFNLNNICESHHSENGYKWYIDDVEKERKCWEISSQYRKILISALNKQDKVKYEQDHSLGVYDIIRKIETGKWK